MLWESEEGREALWATELTDLYLGTSGLFRGATKEGAARPLGAGKLCALHLRLEPRATPWSPCATRLLCRGVLHLLAHVCAGSSVPSQEMQELSSAVREWGAHMRAVVTAHETDGGLDDGGLVLRLASALPGLILGATRASASAPSVRIKDLCS